jgi:hypothetical protein
MKKTERTIEQIIAAVKGALVVSYGSPHKAVALLAWISGGSSA